MEKKHTEEFMRQNAKYFNKQILPFIEKRILDASVEEFEEYKKLKFVDPYNVRKFAAGFPGLGNLYLGSFRYVIGFIQLVYSVVCIKILYDIIFAGKTYSKSDSIPIIIIITGWLFWWAADAVMLPIITRKRNLQKMQKVKTKENRI